MSIRLFFASIKHACRGLLFVWKREQNFRMQCFIAIIVLLFAYVFRISRSDSIVLFLLILLVLLLEIINSVFEQFVDIVKPRMHDHVGLVKDIMASAVLCASIGAASIGTIIFFPYVLSLFL